MRVLILAMLFSSVASAQNYLPLPVMTERVDKAQVIDVKLLSAKTVVEESQYYQDRHIEIKLGVTMRASLCEKMKAFEYLGSQASLDSPLNPSDFYVRVRTEWIKGCATGSMGKPVYHVLSLKYFVSQRDFVEKGKPWGKPNRFFARSSVRHMSFDSGMLGGHNRWKMYRIDYSDLSAVKVTFVKQYSYVQGKAIDQKTRR